MLLLLFGLVPSLFWPGATGTAPKLQQAGITHIAVPASQANLWKKVSGISVETVDLNQTVKLPSPGVSFHMSEASASRVPWISSNGARIMRQPDAHFSYDVKGNTAALAAAEAFAYGSAAVVETDTDGLQPLADMLKFLRSIERPVRPGIADVGFIDDGSPTDLEVMNLLVRDNLLFKIVHSPSPNLKLNVRIGTKQYPAAEAKNPDLMEHKIRSNLTDARRTIRIYGTSIVVARVTGTPGKLRLHLLNYGAGEGTRIGEFRVRVLGRYSKAELHSFERSGDHVIDYSPESDATEFTVPGLKVYAVVDLTK